ncbi:transglycosylase SLT domain-containing protein [Methyloferula stellata]|uniref:transglycosylase SLT domain-containing protein n=1 Tax=Methyloferula stellata TaxID=876270 RepID=UPI00037F3AF5|nr:lytic transglycosylase domain-containing protein [Methyloferula stellata]
MAIARPSGEAAISASPKSVHLTDDQPHIATPSVPELKQLAEQAAAANELPTDYFTRLISQESGFNTTAISLAGAQGIAQFMPATARDYGLKDPFDPIEALPKSAELLRDLKNQFGNLGLAAAAYNAGARRVHDWLNGRGYLPKETWAYVYAVTGHSPEDWAPPGAHLLKNDTIDLPGIAGRNWNRLDARRNWELALLVSIGGADTQRALASATTHVSEGQRRVARGKATRLNPELSLCGSCIVQKFY